MHVHVLLTRTTVHNAALGKYSVVSTHDTYSDNLNDGIINTPTYVYLCLRQRSLAA